MDDIIKLYKTQYGATTVVDCWDAFHDCSFWTPSEQVYGKIFGTDGEIVKLFRIPASEHDPLRAKLASCVNSDFKIAYVS